MWPELSATTSLALTLLLVAGSALAAATLLPLSSEAVLLAAVARSPEWTVALVLAATAGNVAGSLITVALGRLGARKAPSLRVLRWLEPMRRAGAWLLLASWVPVVGDALCLAAGILRLPWPGVLLAILVGKAARYGLLVVGWQILAF